MSVQVSPPRRSSSRNQSSIAMIPRSNHIDIQSGSTSSPNSTSARSNNVMSSTAVESPIRGVNSSSAAGTASAASAAAAAGSDGTSSFLWKSPGPAEFGFEGASPNLFSFMASPPMGLPSNAGQAHLYPTSRDWTPFRQDATKNLPENLSFPESVLSSPKGRLEKLVGSIKGLNSSGDMNRGKKMQIGSSGNSSGNSSSSSRSSGGCEEVEGDYSLHFLSPGMHNLSGSSSYGNAGIASLQAVASSALDFDGAACYDNYCDSNIGSGSSSSGQHYYDSYSTDKFGSFITPASADFLGAAAAAAAGAAAAAAETSSSSSAATAVPSYSLSSSIETTSSTGSAATTQDTNNCITTSGGSSGSVSRLPPKARKMNKRSLEQQQQQQQQLLQHQMDPLLMMYQHQQQQQQQDPNYHLSALTNNTSMTPYAQELTKLNHLDPMQQYLRLKQQQQQQQQQAAISANASKTTKKTTPKGTKGSPATTATSATGVTSSAQKRKRAATAAATASSKAANMGPPQKGPSFASISVPMTTAAAAAAAAAAVYTGDRGFVPSSTTAFAPLKKGAQAAANAAAAGSAVKGTAAGAARQLTTQTAAASMGKATAAIDTYKSPPTGGGTPAVALTGDNSNSDGSNIDQVQISGVLLTCNCKKSKCLKMYCDCFRFAELCRESCNCNSCFNMDVANVDRQTAIATILERKPDAFKPRVADDTAGHLTGCHCRKSNCLKKYCECYTGGAACVDRCRCIECKNKPELYATNTAANLAATTATGKGKATTVTATATATTTTAATAANAALLTANKTSPRKVRSTESRAKKSGVQQAINSSSGNTPNAINALSHPPSSLTSVDSSATAAATTATTAATTTATTAAATTATAAAAAATTTAATASVAATLVVIADKEKGGYCDAVNAPAGVAVVTAKGTAL